MIKVDYKAKSKCILKIMLIIVMILVIILLVSFTIFTAVKSAPNDINTVNILELNNGAVYVSSDKQYSLFFLTDTKNIILTTSQEVYYLGIAWQTENIFACTDRYNNQYIFMQHNSDTITCDKFVNYLSRYKYAE